MSEPEPNDDDAPEDADAAVVAGDAAAQRFSLIVDDASAGQRLDAYLAAAIPAVSRARIKRSIDRRGVEVGGAPQKASYRVAAGERIELALAPVAESPLPEPIALDVLWDDAAIVVVNKPPGMVVHPAKGHWAGTLAAALVHRFQQLSGVGGIARPGIVHRLDRDTSGVIVVAKTDAAHEALAVQFHDRTVGKEYLAIVAGSPDRDADRVVAAIGPHPTHRERMALREDHPDSRPAETHFDVLERFPGFALVRARPKTGRTHQIRLHLAHLRTPVLCDRHYGGRTRLTAGELRAITRRKHALPETSDDQTLLDRQALHARRLEFSHPLTGARVAFEAPLPPDFQRVLVALRQIAAS